MNSYNDAYRNYYSNINRRVNPRGKTYSGNSIEDLLTSRSRKKKRKSKVIDVIAKQIVGSIALLVLALTIKMTPSKEAQDFYAYTKEIIKSDFNYESFVEGIKTLDIKEYLDKIDSGL